jgi:hypothetical protein
LIKKWWGYIDKRGNVKVRRESKFLPSGSLICCVKALDRQEAEKAVWAIHAEIYLRDM